MFCKSLAICAISLLLCSEASAFASTQWMVVSDYCQNYTIIRPSRKDTPDTLRQIVRENEKWRAVCAVKK